MDALELAPRLFQRLAWKLRIQSRERFAHPALQDDFPEVRIAGFRPGYARGDFGPVKGASQLFEPGEGRVFDERFREVRSHFDSRSRRIGLEFLTDRQHVLTIEAPGIEGFLSGRSEQNAGIGFGRHNRGPKFCAGYADSKDIFGAD